ncbi:hypothetical protein EW146_g1267 [Bondarzewia mesenterica]|uniref:FAD-binding PCMH-type domain-containing protein n=1 Tax=Bondarzewia mesenterica TaxID=1095465 RepID=A0A4S4M4D2_9AGAM|nr:hypothetical protein EW146_g1267 [Bondarzewia mesenterica]
MLSTRTIQRRIALATRRWAHTSASASTRKHLNTVTPDDLAHFAKILPQNAILSTLAPSSLPSSELESYNNDWMGKYHGRATTVLRPHTAEQVSKIMKWCYDRRIGVVPQGGNTGLVGGSVPIRDELVINMGNMNKVRSFDTVSGALVADAGCILESLSEYIAPHNHIMPLDLGAKGSCQIGGNVATNAGGLRLLRYGSLHGSVLGLEVVLPDGTILDNLSTLRKDNTGYDLKQLFIGAEGSLGIITGVSISTPPAPQATNNVILALPKFDNVLPLFKITRQHLSEILSAFEFIDRTAYDLAVKHGQGKGLSDGEVDGAECFVLLETSGGKREHDEEKLNTLLETLMDADEPLINTGVVSQSPTQFAQLWRLREGVTEAVSKEGKAYKYDISVPLASFKDVVDTVREHLRAQGLLHENAVKHVIGYGHVGDGNLHLNIIAAAYTPEIEAALEPFVYELVASYNGSISAEHGLGAMKAHAIHYSKSEVAVDLMKKIKDLLDPRGIMNPGKVEFTPNLILALCNDHQQSIIMPIFQDGNGMAVKFFIQKDLSTEVQAELCETITSLGGRVESKIPRQGFILIQPGTTDAERLRGCWRSVERPDRHFVPYSYVEACKIAGMLLKQIFVENGEPIKFHIDSSIANVNARAALSARVMHSGGDPTASAQSARVILADPNTEVFQHLVKNYQGIPDKYVESYLWVKKCVEKGAVVYTPLVYKNPGGRRPGEERTQFTEEDEEHLCNWIAAKIPYKETGGRTGNRLYQQLCEQVNEPEFAWVSRHTWQSWRERYKKNAQRLDVMIQAIVEQKKPLLGEKGQYGYVRRPEEKQKRSRKRKNVAGGSGVGPDDDFMHAGPHMHLAMPMPVQNGHHNEGLAMITPMPVGMYPHPPPHDHTRTPLPHMNHLPAPGGGPMDANVPAPGLMLIRKSPAEEEMEDDETEWAVRVGNDPPPAWGKRKSSEEREEEEVKRQRTDDAQLMAPPGGPGPIYPHEVTNGVLHVVDQSIRDIAHEYRFTVEEVQEYYDRCGAMDRTRVRFKKMRDVLSMLPDDNNV